MREERFRNRTKNGRVQSSREERVRNRTKNGRGQSLREERVRNKTKNGGVRMLREERVRNKTNNLFTYYGFLLVTSSVVLCLVVAPTQQQTKPTV